MNQQPKIINVSSRGLTLFSIPETMQRLLIACFITACCAASPELVNPENAEVPFVGNEFVGVSEHGAGYAFKVERSNSNCAILLNKDSSVLDLIEFGKNIEIHSLNWTVGGAWFLVRVKTNMGSKVAALAYCDTQRKDNQIILYKADVGKDDMGKIFDISKGEDDRVKVVCRFRNPNDAKYAFYQGLLKRADLEVISREDFLKRYPDVANIGPDKPLSRVPE